MTEPTPPTGRDDDFDPVPGADFDAGLGLVHASIDDELTAEEQASIQPDETWRTRVSEARKAVDAVQAALPLPPVDEERREAQLTAALAAFDELHGTGEDVAVPPPASRQHPPPTDASPSRGTDELAHRRNAREWLRRAPIGIAAAVLAAVVVVGATQLGDDDADETATVTDSDDTSSDDALIEAGDAADGGQSTTGVGAAPYAEDDEGPSAHTYAEEFSTTAAAARSYSMDEQPGSVDTFVDTIAAMIGGDMRGVHITDDDGLGPTCDRQQVVRLVATPGQESDLVWVRAVLDDRPVVGVIDHNDPSQVTIIDLDRCAVVAVESL